jgi:dihydrofolate reductase
MGPPMTFRLPRHGCSVHESSASRSTTFPLDRKGSRIVRRIRYQVAASLDGYIAGPNGEFDWIIMDPDIDFTALFNQFDTALMGRRTFEGMMQQQGSAAMPGMKTLVFSRTLRQQDHPDVTIVAESSERTLAAVREESGKDIWLFGGGSLFRSLLELGVVDTVEVAIIPVVLGGGIPLVQPPARQTKLKLTGHRVYKTGIVLLEYTIENAPRRKTKTKR